MNLIIIDDEPKARNGLAKLLGSNANWKVLRVFEHAIDAIKFLYENPVDVMITDIRMPEISGLELIQQARQIDRELQIIIISGYSDFSYAQKAIELGVRRYLTKPTRTKELISILTAIEKELDEKIKAETENPNMIASNLIVAKAIEYIEKNYSDKITLKAMADELYISPNYLCRLFKHHTNKNLMEYITAHRMNKAKEYLKDIQYKVSEVAKMVGYTDTKYFSSTFKKTFKMTPLEYRNGKLERQPVNILN